MTDTPFGKKANQAAKDSSASMTEAELLAELLKVLQGSDQVQTGSSPDSLLEAIAPSNKPSPPAQPSFQPLVQPPVQPSVQPDKKPALEENPPVAPPASLPDSLLDDLIASVAKTVEPKTVAPHFTETSQEPEQPLSNPAPTSLEEDAFLELQKLLFNVDQSQLDQLRERLEDPERRAADVGEVLRQAIVLQTLDADQHNLLVDAIVPTVEQAIQESVQKDELVIANAMFPIMGPAMRKAIATALESTMQRLDQMLEQSLSPRALQWKLEALRTGKSFAEVVLLRTLLYRVEQVFLIHRPTGLLLQHVMAPFIAVQDPDLVSSMLQAITDFMQDSFAVQAGDTLETLKFGDLTIWIEQGPHAVLAGVLRGQAPLELRLVFRRAIERIHQEMGLSLTAFQGDSAPFVATRPHLESCFQTEYKTLNSKKGRPYFWILFTCIVAGMGLLGYREWLSRHHWAAYLKQLQAEPGIVITTAEKRWGDFFIAGLRDPLAVDPTTLLSASKVDPKTVTSQWQPYLSLEPKLLAARASQILHPPATVSLTVDNQGVLIATGAASLRWIEESQKLATAIPGITQFRNEVKTSELQALAESRNRLEAQILLFEEGSAVPLAKAQTLDDLVKELEVITQLTGLLGRQVQIQIVGRSNQGGSQIRNLLLSQDRADVVLEALVARGIDPSFLAAIGIGTQQPLSSTQIPTEQINRSVTFKVLFTNPSNSRVEQR